MGLGRLIQKRDIKKTIKFLKETDSEMKEDILEKLLTAGGRWVMLGYDIEKFMNEGPSNIEQEVQKELQMLFFFNDLRRKTVTDALQLNLDIKYYSNYWFMSILCHCVRGIYDYKLKGKPEQLNMCKVIWYLLTNKIEDIPLQFR